MPHVYFREIMPNVTINHTCEAYGDNLICDCDLSDLSSYPTLELKIGEIEFNHTISFEPQYYLEKFGNTDLNQFGFNVT